MTEGALLPVLVKKVALMTGGTIVEISRMSRVMRRAGLLGRTITGRDNIDEITLCIRIPDHIVAGEAICLITLNKDVVPVLDWCAVAVAENAVSDNLYFILLGIRIE
jgi:hypothetical protein